MATTQPRQQETKTLGEELFLVHLRRQQATDPSEDDFDHEAPIHRLSASQEPQVKTVGEELYEVHLRRSMGGESTLQEIASAAEHGDQVDKAKTGGQQDGQKTKKERTKQKRAHKVAHTIQLRNRVVPPRADTSPE